MLLLLYSFFVGTTNAMFYTSSSALLVAIFPSSIIPYAYLAMGGIGIPVSLLFQSLLKKTSVRNTILTSNSLLILSMVLLGLVVDINAPRWLIFVNYVWYRVVAFITIIGFWTMANRAFTLDQGKRLFGLITSGEVISSMIGFFSIPLLIKVLQTQDLLFIAAASMFFCLFLTFKIENSGQERKQGERSESSSKKIIRTTYFKYMFILAFVPVIVMYLADFIFLDLSKAKFHDADVLAGFFGVFFGFSAVVELITKALLSGKMMNRYGLIFSLSVSSVVFLIVLSMAAVVGIVSGTGSLFFSLIALVKLLERVLRSGINDPAYQILYQPLDKNVRPSAQAIIEGYSKTFAVIFSALIIILFTSVKNLSSIHLTLFFILTVTGWFFLSRKTFHQYTLKVKDKLFSQSHKNEEKVLSKNPYIKANNDRILFHMGALIINTNPYSFSAIVVKLPESQHKDFCQGAISAGLQVPLKIAYLDFIHNKNNGTADKDVVAMFNNRKRIPQTDKNDLLQSVALLVEVFDYNAYSALNDLLKSDDQEIKMECILAAGKTGRLPLLPGILQNVFSTDLRNFSLHAIKQYGDSGITSLLKSILAKQHNDRLPGAIRIALSGNHNFTNEQSELIEKLFFSCRYYGKEALMEIISGSNLIISNSARESFHAEFESECRNLFFLMAVENEMESISDENIHLSHTLKTDINSRMHFIFALLSTIYDKNTVAVIANIIEDSNSASKMYVVEMMNLIFTKSDIEFLMPLIDNYCFGKRFTPNMEPYFYQRQSATEAMEQLINARGKTVSGYTRAEALAVYPPGDSYKNLLISNFLHPENVVAEYATLQLYKYYPEVFKHKRELLPKAWQDKIDSRINAQDSILLLDAFRIVSTAFHSSLIPVFAMEELLETSVRKGYSEGDSTTINSKRAYGFVISGKVTSTGYLDVAPNGFFMSTVRNAEESLIFKFPSVTKLIIFNTTVFDNFATNRPVVMEAINSFYFKPETP